MSLAEIADPPEDTKRLCRKGESVLVKVSGRGWVPGKIVKNGKSDKVRYSVVLLDKGGVIRLPRSDVRSGRVRKDHSAHALDESVTLRSVERELRKKNMQLTVTQDEDGYLVTLVQNGRKYLGLSPSLTESFREAFDEAGST